MITKNKILNSLHEVFENSKKSELNFEKFKNIQKELKTIATYLNISKVQVVYFSIITVRNFNGDQTRIKDICEHLGLPAIKILSEIELIEDLLNKSFIKKCKSRRNYDDSLSNATYYIENKLNDAIIKGLPCPELKIFKIESSLDLIEQINSIIDNAEDENLETEKILNNIELLYEKHNDFIFFKSLDKYDLQPLDKIILLKIIWKSILGQDGLQINTFLDNFTQNKRAFVRTVQSIYNKSNNLIKYDLLDSKRGGFMDDVEYYPSSKLKELLKEDNILINDDKSTIKKDNIILPSSIKNKKLFYNEDIKKEINQLENLLNNDKYNELIIKLKNKNLPLNLNILLFGHPGTGKTETVLQIAKATNREVMKIDISSTKSKWFGDSEKIIKRIFDQYHSYSETCEFSPILLFNEADAILSKRNSNTNSSTSQTENTIQNILLEELENFKGIFIATTNLASNLDSAFERRFLFKLKFNKPELRERISILEDKIPGYEEADYIQIANFHDFTGSEIENITRKIEISDILGEPINSIDSILQLCQNEIVNMKKKNNIGFINY